MLLTEARRPARVSATGELVTLVEQDRGAWDAGLIAEGHALVRQRLAAVAAGQARPGRYQILAAINAVHTSAGDVRDTDWSQVVALYDQLAAIDPSPIVALNRAVALAELDGPEVALAIIDRLDLPRLPRLPRHPRRPAASPRPHGRRPHRVREGHRAGDQHRRDRLPHPPARPAGGCGRRFVTRTDIVRTPQAGTVRSTHRSTARRGRRGPARSDGTRSSGSATTADSVSKTLDEPSIGVVRRPAGIAAGRRTTAQAARIRADTTSASGEGASPISIAG